MLERIVPPAEPLIAVQHAKAHLRVDHHDDDALIDGLIEAATAHLDGPNGILGRALVTQTWRWSLDDWPAGGRVIPPFDGATQIVAVRMMNDDLTVTLDPAGYLFRRGVLFAPLGWPTMADYAEIDFVAGYGGAADVPAAIKHAALLLVGAWYENREETVIGVPVAALPIDVSVRALVGPYMQMRV